jgi:hypothetical protein
MRGPSLISGYLDALAGQLPGPVVEELADGLEETYRRHLGPGLTSEAAAQAAVTEFGDADLIAAAFTRTHPARRAARRLLAAGPVVGACWAVALVTGRAWTWLVPRGGQDRARRGASGSRGPAGCRSARYPVPARWPGGYGRMRRHRRAGWFHDHRRTGR